jgi:hypothetical protein
VLFEFKESDSVPRAETLDPIVSQTGRDAKSTQRTPFRSSDTKRSGERSLQILLHIRAQRETHLKFSTDKKEHGQSKMSVFLSIRGKMLLFARGD